MLFLLFLLLLIVSEWIFLLSIWSIPNAYLASFGFLHLGAILGSIVLFIWGFRNVKMRSNYRLGFSIFGLFVALALPAIVYLIPGLFFLSFQYELARNIGFCLAGLHFIAILYGIFYGRWNWKVRTVDLSFDHLPEAMDGVKILQISDVHIGSFYGQTQKVQKAIDLINSRNADYFLFTGDLVNNKADEFRGWEALFSQIEVKKGKYSILGNHDYGDYISWDYDHEKAANLQELIRMHELVNWKPLLNDAVELEKGFWLLGVENWGRSMFRQSGKLEETLAKTGPGFKLLMSHDPSHFDAQVIHTDIDLTLSGHTHGMQFGIERFGIRWSPVSFVYPKWAGLYQVGKQFLYVNRGFGYIGFPGRVGIYPEITEFTLRRSKAH
jgi:predicted MPP superfamily phosphohydrolase